MRLFAVLILLGACLVGCSGFQVRAVGFFDAKDKTMGIPPGGAGPLGQIKDLLRAEGWKLYVIDRGEVTIEGQGGEKTVLKETAKFNARYRLQIEYKTVGREFWTGKDAHAYDISIADNQNGSEIVTISGVEAGMAERLIATVKQQTK